MKANNGSGNISDRDNWETPQRLFDKLNSQYRFDFDCCANEQNKKTDLFSSDFETAVKFLPLDRVSCWMNPPFSKAMDMFNVFFDNVKQGVAIYRCDNLETKIWQEVIFPFYDWVFIPKGRVNYVGIDGDGCRFPSALVGIGVLPPEDIDGVCLIVGEK